MIKAHRWSGWPGAFCLDCGAEDPTELALFDPDFDLESSRYLEPEKQANYEQALVCLTLSH